MARIAQILIACGVSVISQIARSKTLNGENAMVLPFVYILLDHFQTINTRIK